MIPGPARCHQRATIRLTFLIIQIPRSSIESKKEQSSSHCAGARQMQQRPWAMFGLEAAEISGVPARRAAAFRLTWLVRCKAMIRTTGTTRGHRVQAACVLPGARVRALGRPTTFQENLQAGRLQTPRRG